MRDAEKLDELRKDPYPINLLRRIGKVYGLNWSESDVKRIAPAAEKQVDGLREPMRYVIRLRYLDLLTHEQGAFMLSEALGTYRSGNHFQKMKDAALEILARGLVPYLKK